MASNSPLLPLFGPPAESPSSGAPPATVDPGGVAPLHSRAPRVFLETFGCQMNFLDSELVRGRLTERQFAFTSRRDEADVVAFNTCAVRDHAEERVRARLHELKRAKQRHPDLVVAVLGCMAQREGEALLERFPHVDILCGTREFGRIGELVAAVKEGAGPIVALGEHDPLPDWKRDLSQRPHRHSAFVTIQRGCDRACTFCVVPRTRGPEVERTMDDLEREVRALVADGVVDVTLLGQIVNAYGRKSGSDASLARLLRRLDRVPGLARLRFVTSFPTLLTADLMQAIEDCESVVSYLHLPVQSGANSCLKRMARGYTAESYHRLVDRLREVSPKVELATDVIVGFSGETDAEFAATAELMRRIEFVQAFIFKYSERPGTAAERLLPDDVPQAVKEARNQELLRLQEEIQRRRNRARIGALEQVLVDGPSKRDRSVLSGRTSANRIVHFRGEAALVGRIVDVRVRDATALSLSGDLASAG
jgi:tRNA-2-methylthio-N6-dimethylallyladenosine synthase